MKKSLLLLLACSFGFSASIFAKGESYSQVYDEFNPNGYTTSVQVDIDGDIQNGRIPLLTGKNPLLMKNEDGTPVMPTDTEKCDVRFVVLNFNGAEESRSFHLRGGVNTKKDEYTKIVVCFTARRNGVVRFTAWHHGGGRNHHPGTPPVPYEYPNYGLARYAKFWSRNTVFKDPNCGNPKAWGIGKFECFPNKIKAEKVMEQNQAVSSALRTPKGISQLIPVKANKEVTITFYVRADEIHNAKM